MDAAISQQHSRHIIIWLYIFGWIFFLLISLNFIVYILFVFFVVISYFVLFLFFRSLHLACWLGTSWESTYSTDFFKRPGIFFYIHNDLYFVVYPLFKYFFLILYFLCFYALVKLETNRSINIGTFWPFQTNFSMNLNDFSDYMKCMQNSWISEFCWVSAKVFLFLSNGTKVSMVQSTKKKKKLIRA